MTLLEAMRRQGYRLAIINADDGRAILLDEEVLDFIRQQAGQAQQVGQGQQAGQGQHHGYL